jgi:hypothetical protein
MTVVAAATAKHTWDNGRRRTLAFPLDCMSGTDETPV